MYYVMVFSIKDQSDDISTASAIIFFIFGHKTKRLKNKSFNIVQIVEQATTRVKNVYINGSFPRAPFF